MSCAVKNVHNTVVVAQVGHEVGLECFRVLELRGVDSECVIGRGVIVSAIVMMHSHQLAVPIFALLAQIRQAISAVLSKVEKPNHKVNLSRLGDLFIPDD